MDTKETPLEPQFGQIIPASAPLAAALLWIGSRVQFVALTTLVGDRFGSWELGAIVGLALGFLTK